MLHKSFYWFSVSKNLLLYFVMKSFSSMILPALLCCVYQGFCTIIYFYCNKNVWEIIKQLETTFLINSLKIVINMYNVSHFVLQNCNYLHNASNKTFQHAKQVWIFRNFYLIKFFMNASSLLTIFVHHRFRYNSNIIIHEMIELKTLL